MKVLKFGGTSIGTPERMQHVAQLVMREGNCVVVLSAVAKTTDALEGIVQALEQQHVDEALEKIADLRAHYDLYVDALFDTDEALAEAQALVTTHFDFIRSFTQDVFTVNEERMILAQGELLSTALFHQYLTANNIDAGLISALDFMRLDEHREPDPDHIEEHLQKVMAIQKDKAILITQGYICRDSFGEIDNLRRGGSDYSASLIGAALQADEIQIWTDIDGMHNNDPRYVEHTKPIHHLSFDEAAELAYFGAKILHPATVQPAKQHDIPVRVLNTLVPTAPGTKITTQFRPGEIKAVAAKDGLTAVNIKSYRMLMAYGFLRKVFEIFELYKTPIDMMTTSEVGVSLTIDDPTHIEAITADLAQYGKVSIFHDHAIVCVVGDFVADKPGLALKVLKALQHIPISMISYGGSRNNISFLVDSGLKADTLNALHQGLFDV